WEQRLGKPHLRVEVDRHRALHVLIATLGKAGAPGGPGIVDEQVKASMMLNQVSVDALRCVLVEQIHSERARVFTERRGECLQTLLAARYKDDPRVGHACEPTGGGLADAARGARHDRHERMSIHLCGGAV